MTGASISSGQRLVVVISGHAVRETTPAEIESMIRSSGLLQSDGDWTLEVLTDV